MRLAPVAVLGLLSAVVSAPAAAEPPQAVVARLVLGDLDGAASAWERAASGSADALAEAALLRLGLSDEVRAAAHAEALERSFGRARPELVARVTLARARRLEGLGRWADLRDLLEPRLARFDAAASPEAHQLVARACDRTGDAAAAARVFGRLLRVPAKSAAAGDAVAEAHLFFADEELARADRVHVRPYTGGSDRRTLVAYLAGPAARWLERKEHGVRLAERSYLAVLGIEVPPPRPPSPPPVRMLGGDPSAPIEPDLDGVATVPAPRWAVPAAARLGLAWAGLAAEIRALPIPWSPPASYEELASTYVNSLDGPGDTLRFRAKRACELSVRLARDHRLVDPDARACEAWLGRTFRAEHRLLEELFPSPAPPFAAGSFAPISAP